MDVYTVREDWMKYAGKNQLVAFLSWLDFCDQLTSLASARVAAGISSAIRRNFLETALRPRLLQTLAPVSLNLNKSLNSVQSINTLCPYVLFWYRCTLLHAFCRLVGQRLAT